MITIDNNICVAEACTLCMACANACPTGAVLIGLDDNGYEKILIDRSKCIHCGLCGQVCQRRSTVSRNTPIVTYAAQAADKDALEKSASGGAFQMLAQTVLENGGVCYGCYFGKNEEQFYAEHIRIEAMEDLTKILNSKYIPSRIGRAYQCAKQDLDTGRTVLFSGTPCQIQGLRAYLNRDYEHLLTVDLICHGVTSAKLFNAYIEHIEQKNGIECVDYCFRDKSVSWGTNFSYTYRNRTDSQQKTRVKHCPREESSYMAHYLSRDIFREKCYACDCANTARVSDFTLGDYWEIEREHPEFVTKYKPKIVLKRGVSCILVNSEKGTHYVQALKEKMILREVELESVTAHNSNLIKPSARGKRRTWVLHTFATKGYAPIEEAYRARIGRKILTYRLKNSLKSHLPDRVRIWVYRIPLLRRIVFHQ